jgi:hypothetical protein
MSRSGAGTDVTDCGSDALTAFRAWSVTHDPRMLWALDGTLQRAVARAVSAGAVDSVSPHLLQALGETQAALGTPAQAATTLRECVKRHGVSVHNCMLLASLYRRQGLWEKAEAQLQAALSLLNRHRGEVGARLPAALGFHPSEGEGCGV